MQARRAHSNQGEGIGGRRGDEFQLPQKPETRKTEGLSESGGGGEEEESVSSSGVLWSR